MSMLGVYKKQSLFGGWTRVEMLLQIYDRAIACLEGCRISLEQDDQAAFAQHLMGAQKAILAIHSGLKPDEHDVAFNIARLLHFVLLRIEKRDFEAACKVLQELRDGFAAVADQVDEMERAGEIPPIPASDAFESLA